MANVLVSGGAGYVGSICCEELLRRDHAVTIIDNLSTGHRDSVPADAVFRQADIGSRFAIAELLSERQFDCVFHFAAKALIPESVRDPAAFFATNLVASFAFLEELRAAGIHKFVYSSTAAVYGDPIEVPICEDHPTRPVNSYGESKLAFERALHWYASAYGWSVMVFRYFNACGATATNGERHEPETHIVPLLLQAAFGRGQPFEIYGDDYPTPDGTCIRDYVHVVDIAEAHLLAMQKMHTPGFHVYNIGNGTGHSVWQLLRAVEEVTGGRVPVRVGTRRPGDPAILVASHTKLVSELGWKAHYPDLRSIVSSASAWMLAHTPLADRSARAA